VELGGRPARLKPWCGTGRGAAPGVVRHRAWCGTGRGAAPAVVRHHVNHDGRPMLPLYAARADGVRDDGRWPARVNLDNFEYRDLGPYRPARARL